MDSTKVRPLAHSIHVTSTDSSASTVGPSTPIEVPEEPLKIMTPKSILTLQKSVMGGTVQPVIPSPRDPASSSTNTNPNSDILKDEVEEGNKPISRLSYGEGSFPFERNSR